MRPMKPDPGIRVQAVRIPTENGGMSALLLSPLAAPKNAAGILWLHGGGYIAGMKEMVHASRAVDLVKKFGAVVLSPGYRLALKAPYPAAIDDCYAALEWVILGILAVPPPNPNRTHSPSSRPGPRSSHA